MEQARTQDMTVAKTTIKPIEIVLKHVNKSFGEKEVLKDINLSIEKGQFVAIVGKSGSGKSTLLRLIAKLEKISSGSLLFNGETPEESKTKMTMMYQDSRLFPWKKVIDNVGLGLNGQWQEKAKKVLDAVGLLSFQDEWPSTLSGGQQQRVALARALVREPSLLMLDEPLSALDALTRMEMQQLIETIWLENGFTTLLVTHDVREAVRLADRVILIEDGKIGMDVINNSSRPRQLADSKLIQLENEVLSKIINK